MESEPVNGNLSPGRKSRDALSGKLKEISEGCTRCQACQKECAFLRKYGKPGEIADAYNPADGLYQAMAFECSLCRLCVAVCPAKINPAEMFLEMRREKIRRDPQPYPEHSGLLAYEKKGNSRLFSYYALPAGCDTVFFTGCTLPGTRPEQTFQLYKRMKQTVPQLGIVLDCCNKISHDLGREEHFRSMFGEMRDYLISQGVKKVIAACPNCYRMFDEYGDGLSVTTVYEILAENMAQVDSSYNQPVSIHDPCGLRFNEDVHAAVRCLVAQKGLRIVEMKHRPEDKLLRRGGERRVPVAGIGGTLGNEDQGICKWKEIAGLLCICANHLGGLTPTSHIVDYVFDPEGTVEGRVKVSKAPMTYLNRLKLKRRFKKEVDAAVTRERTFNAEENRKSSSLKRLLLLGLLVAAIFLIRYAGGMKYLEQDALRNLIVGYGILAPAIYMLIYALAPVLLLPGLPITIVGGILFGPFWGVVYTITGATAGACLAFLVARYVARDWVESKLRSPRWRSLDKEVEKHGWKMVAFTRLIPAFPFNLLNYAFGLTKIKFSHYAITTFICMLPACIAFIVFSSSLLDLIRGKISPGLIIGVVLIALVSLIPFFHKKFRGGKGNSDAP
jgi:uncharacterized membrane protein YdjX (TVP38/TMEM64 family)